MCRRFDFLENTGPTQEEFLQRISSDVTPGDVAKYLVNAGSNAESEEMGGLAHRSPSNLVLQYHVGKLLPSPRLVLITRRSGTLPYSGFLTSQQLPYIPVSQSLALKG